jgi:class 3 adenylate cyclase
MPALPTGVVTLLFSDIEVSTQIMEGARWIAA